MKKIGIIEGKGTGSELIDVFKTVIHSFTNIEYIELNEQINTYWSNKNLDGNIIKKQSLKDANKLADFLQRHKDELCCVFRTAINAETLYYLRTRFDAIKLINIEKENIVIVRDESQGFYSIDNYDFDQGKISFASSLSLEKFQRIIKSSCALADKRFYREKYKIWVIYKYHLFSNIIDSWIKSINPNIEIFQPDTGIVNLQSFLEQPAKTNLLVITSNEVGDVLYEFLLYMLHLGSKETSYTTNYYTKLSNIPIYQTVHGSADDISGKDSINPTAVLKIAIKTLFVHFGINITEKGNIFFKKRPFVKNKDTTTDYLELFLKSLKQ